MDTQPLISSFISERFEESQLKHAALILKISVERLIGCLNAGSNFLLNNYQPDVSSSPVDGSLSYNPPANDEVLPGRVLANHDVPYWQEPQSCHEPPVTTGAEIPNIIITSPRNHYDPYANLSPEDFSHVPPVTQASEQPVPVSSQHDTSPFNPLPTTRSYPQDSPTSLGPNTPPLRDGLSRWGSLDETARRPSSIFVTLPYTEPPLDQSPSTPWSETSESGMLPDLNVGYTPTPTKNVLSPQTPDQQRPTMTKKPTYDSSSSHEVDNEQASRKRRRTDHSSSQSDEEAPRPKRHATDALNDQEPNARESSALTKANRACLRCRRHRIRCKPDATNPLNDCIPCQRLKPETRAMAPPCRDLMGEISLYRDQNAPCALHTTRWNSMELKDISRWASDETLIVKVGHVAMDQGYELKVRRFVPEAGDTLYEKWIVDGVERTHQIPPYAIVDMHEATETLKKFIIKSVPDYVRAFVDRQNSLISTTYDMAMRHTRATLNEDEKYLLRNTLFLWVCCRKISNPERFYDQDLPGIEATQDPASPWYQTAPVPPVMIAQMQCILYGQILGPLRRKVLDRLWRMCKRNSRENWYTIYLTMFIILHSCSMFTRRNEEFAHSIGFAQRFVNPSAIAKLHSGSDTLLKHFHYVNKGSLPFQQALEEDGMQELRNAGLDAAQAEFITQTAQWVREQEPVMREKRENLEYGHDLYWISQLYMPNWFRERPKSLE